LCNGVIFFQKKGSQRRLFSKRKSHVPTKWDTIVTAIRARQYGRAIRGLYEATKGSRKQFLRVVANIVRKEISSLLCPGSNFPLCEDISVPNIERFSWTNTLTEFQNSCPMVFTAMKSVITKTSNENTLVRGKSVNLKPQL